MNIRQNELGEVLESVIQARRSTRRFRTDSIPDSELKRLVNAGVYAPTGSNAQNVRFLVVTDRDEIRRIGAARFVWPYPANQKKKQAKNPDGIIGYASALIIVFTDATKTVPPAPGEYHIWEALEIQNASAAIENILLLSTAMGIGSCWISASQKMNYTRLLTGKAWREVFVGYDIPGSYKIQGIIALGYPVHEDEAGFPRGEKRHGVVLQETRRKNVEFYLIPSQNALGQKGMEGRIEYCGAEKIFLTLGRSMVSLLVRATLFIDRFLDSLERKVFKRSGIKYGGD